MACMRVLALVLCMVLWGCGDKKPQSVSNIPANVAVKMKYDEKSYVLKLETKQKITIEFILPKPEDATKVRAGVESFDFKRLLLDSHDDWLRILAEQQADEVSATCIGKSTNSDGIVARQSADGTIVVEISESFKVVVKITIPRSSGTDLCVGKFVNENKLKNVFTATKVLYDGFIASLNPNGVGGGNSKALRPDTANGAN